MTWILVYFFFSHSTGNVPGFRTEDDCKQAARKIVLATKHSLGSAVEAVCVSQKVAK